MRRRIRTAALISVVLAMVLFGAPLAGAVHQLILADERAELDRWALTVALTVPPDLVGGGVPEHLPSQPDGVHLAVYDAGGTLLAGEGPPDDELVAQAARGAPATGFSGHDLVSTVPVVTAEGVVAVARASSQRWVLDGHLRTAWGAMALAAAVALAVAALAAGRLAQRLARPVERLRERAERLGSGDFTVAGTSGGIPEVDAVAAALDDTARGLGGLLERERAFASQASHQLRTPLTGLRLGLDAAVDREPAALRAAVREALVLVDELEATVEDLLAISRGRGAPGPVDVAALLATLPARWEAVLAGAGRSLAVRCEPDLPPAGGRAPAVRQVLEVLVDNAVRHGGGRVAVTARDAGGLTAVDVEDEGRPGRDEDAVEDAMTGVAGTGPGPAWPRPLSSSGGIGLPMARSLAAADGGRLAVSVEPGRTRATLLLPAPPQDGAGTATPD